MLYNTSMTHFLRTLLPNLLKCFAPRYLPWHALACLLTYILVATNIDWQYFLATQHIYQLFFAAAIIGGLLPILLPLGLFIYGGVRKNKAVVRSGFLLTQAALLGFVVSAIYKTFTGRIQPNLHDYALNISHGFQFGFLRHGVFWGWPSSHTTLAFAMALALVTVYPKKRSLALVSLLYALFIGVGVSMSIHWLSDAVAGLIIGSIVGRVVGMSFTEPSSTKAV